MPVQSWLDPLLSGAVMNGSVADGRASPVLVVRCEGASIAIGPRLGPGQGCLACLKAWYVLRSHWIPRPPAASEEQMEQAISVAHAVYQREVTIDWDNRIALFTHSAAMPVFVTVLRRPGCPHCGGRPALPLAEKLAVLANPVTGLLLGVQTVPKAFGLSWAHAAALLPPPHAPLGASGAGPQPAEARRRMVFEAVERHCIAYTGVEPEHVEAQSLLAGPSRQVPAGSVYLHYPGGGADSTGCAAAPTLPMAIEHGYYEVIERDALARWWLARERRPRLRFESDEWLSSVSRALYAAGRSLWFLDLSVYDRISVAAAVTATADGREIYIGAAAGPKLARVLRRAATEMLQFLLWDRVQGASGQRQQWLASATLETHPWLAAGDRRQRAVPPVYHGPPPEGYWVDLTRPSLGIPVARVLVPGLLAMPDEVPL